MRYAGHELSYVLCPGRFAEEQHRDKYLQIYQCWQDVWAETFKELDGVQQLHSDAFTRQDLIGAIFVNGECKAMSVYRYADATLPTMKDDSYFANWSELHRQGLCKRGKNVLVCSYFTIHSTARKEVLGFTMRDLLMALTTQVTLNTQMDVMTGAMRKNRGVHQVAYDWGALPVGIDVPSGHGDALVDLVSFYKPEVRKAHETREMSQVAEQLWNERLVIQQVPAETISHFVPGVETRKKAA